jgi:hypothetical protein
LQQGQFFFRIASAVWSWFFSPNLILGLWNEVDMSEVPEDPEREDRIQMEIIVDAYVSEERAMGWY